MNPCDNLLHLHECAVNWLCWFQPYKWRSILVTVWRQSNPGTTRVPSRRTTLLLLFAKFLPKNGPATYLTSSLPIQLFLVTKKKKTNFNSRGANSPLHMTLSQSCSSLNLTTYFSKIGFNAKFSLRHLCRPKKENFCQIFCANVMFMFRDTSPYNKYFHRNGWRLYIISSSHNSFKAYFNEDNNKIMEVQGEHKVFPGLQTFITRKLRGIQIYFLPVLITNLMHNSFIL
jgi:hypothetical protein